MLCQVVSAARASHENLPGDAFGGVALMIILMVALHLPVLF